MKVVKREDYCNELRKFFSNHNNRVKKILTKKLYGNIKRLVFVFEDGSEWIENRSCYSSFLDYSILGEKSFVIVSHLQIEYYNSDDTNSRFVHIETSFSKDNFISF